MHNTRKQLKINRYFMVLRFFIHFSELNFTKSSCSKFPYPPVTQLDLTIFFSYLHTWYVNLIEFLVIMAQMVPYNIFLSLKPTKITVNLCSVWPTWVLFYKYSCDYITKGRSWVMHGNSFLALIQNIWTQRLIIRHLLFSQ